MNKNNGYYTSTTLVGWRPVVYGPNDETYQIKTDSKGRLRLRHMPFAGQVVKYLQAFVKPALEFEGFVIPQATEEKKRTRKQ